MSAQRGSNGIVDGQATVQAFLRWQSEVEDFKPYIHQGTLSVARVAREAGLNRDVFYTNPEIHDKFWPALQQRLEALGCRRRTKIEPLCRSNIEPGRNAVRRTCVCG